MKDIWTEEFEQYLAGEMNPEQERTFLASLEDEAEKKQAFKWHQAMDKGFDQLAKRQALKDRMKKEISFPEISPTTSNHHHSWVRYAAAASVVLFVAVVSFFLVDNRKMEAYPVARVSIENDKLGLVDTEGEVEELLVDWQVGASGNPTYSLVGNQLILRAEFDKDNVKFAYLVLEGENILYLIENKNFYPLYPTEVFLPLIEENNKVVIELLKKI